jgi:dihydroorotate dehydrogenase (fumarate)
VVKVMMAGGSVAMMTSALLRHGVEHLSATLAQVCDWMSEHDYHSLRTMRGSMSFRSVPDPSAYERANYMKVLRTHALYRTEG